MRIRPLRRGTAARLRSISTRSSLRVGEVLEPRWTPAWAGIPPTTVSPPANTPAIVLNAQNDGSAATSIATTEVDYYSFTATQTGSYRIAATTPSSSLDTVLGVFSSTGARLAYNDDISRTNYDSQLTINLTAGTRYYVGVTNYSSSTRGNYSLAIDGPTPTTTPTPTIDLAGAGLTTSNATAWGQTITVGGSVRNSGNTAAGAFTEQWYLSRDAVGSSDDILLSQASGGGTSYGVAGLAAATTSSTFAATLQLPSTLPSGWSGSSFYIVMRTDAASQVTETNESNNFGQAGSGLDYAPITVGGTTQPGGFQIQLSMSGLTATQQAIFQQAADRWEEVIVGDLPNATYRGQTVDDLLINASASSIDGVGGILGQAGPDAFRSGTSLPYHGSMEFDSADIASMQSNGSLLDVVVHEIGHILGIGTLWSTKGLVTGVGTSNPRYTGAQAVAAYNQIFGLSETSIPVENTGGSGTAGSHWRDSVFRSEVMTGYAGPGSDLPLSLITVASLADLGYQVNRNAADPYTPPGSSVASSSSVRSGSGSTSLQASSLSSSTSSTAGTCTLTAVFNEPTVRDALNARTVDALMAAFASAYDQDLRRLRA